MIRRVVTGLALLPWTVLSVVLERVVGDPLADLPPHLLALLED